MSSISTHFVSITENHQVFDEAYYGPASQVVTQWADSVKPVHGLALLSKRSMISCVRRAGLADPRENARHAPGVGVCLHVGHGVCRERDIEATHRLGAR